MIGLLTQILISNTITFRDLASLASEDIQINIYMDKNIKDYSVEFNIANHQSKTEIYSFFSDVLDEHDMRLDYNAKPPYYKVVYKDKKREVLPASALVSPVDKLHYYTYKIENTNNEDVVEAMSVFTGVNYKYLKQSDMIAYSSNVETHEAIERILLETDNKVLSKTIKITIFAVRKKDLKESGTDIKDFSLSLDGTIGKAFDSLLTDNPATIKINSFFDFDLTLKMMNEWGYSDIFQEPIIKLTNGKKSSTNSVINLPYLKLSATVDSQTNSVTEQYDYKDIGLQVNILPKIKDNWVFLDLDLVLEELISNTDNRPITQKISYKNTIKVEEGTPILLTGIQKMFKKENNRAIPLISHIPLIGELFKNKSKEVEEQNINILIEVL